VELGIYAASMQREESPVNVCYTRPMRYNFSLELCPVQKTKFTEFTHSLCTRAETEYYHDNSNFFPHISLYSIEVDENTQPQLEDALVKIAHQYKHVQAELLPPCLGKDGYIVSFLKESREILLLQQDLIDLVNPLRQGHTDKRFTDRLGTGYYTEEEEQSILQWGSPHLAKRTFHLTLVRYTQREDAARIAPTLALPETQVAICAISLSEITEHRARLIREENLHES